MDDDYRDIQLQFTTHCIEGHYEEIKRMLDNPIIDPTFQDSWCLCMASDSGYEDIVRLLLEDGRVVCDDEHYAFINSYRNGYHNITKMLYEWYRSNDTNMIDVIKYIKHTKALKLDYKEIMRVVQ